MKKILRDVPAVILFLTGITGFMGFPATTFGQTPNGVAERLNTFYSRFGDDAATARINPATGVTDLAYKFSWDAGVTGVSGANKFLKANRDWLGFDPDHISLEQTTVRTRDNIQNVRYRQLHEEVPVYQATASVKLRGFRVIGFIGNINSSIESLSGSYPDIGTAASIVNSSVMEAGRTDQIVKIEPVIIPVDDGFHRGAIATGENFMNYIIDGAHFSVVDAFSRELENRTSTPSTSTVLPVGIGFDGTGGIREPDSDQSPKGNIRVTANGKAFTGDPQNPEDGTTVSTVTLSRLESSTKLDGEHLTVRYSGTAPQTYVQADGNGDYLDAPNPQPAVLTGCTTTDENNNGGFNVNNHDCSDFDASNVYYHADMYAEYVINTLGVPNSVLPEVDVLIHDNSRQGGASAIVDFDIIRFGHRSEDDTGEIFYNPAKYRDVIYHEYTHVVTHALGHKIMSSLDGGLSEGFSDYLSASYVNNPIFAEKFVNCPGDQIDDAGETGVGPEHDHLRRLDSPPVVWHQSNYGSNNYNIAECQRERFGVVEVFTEAVGAAAGNVYDQGMIVAGALWDLRAEATAGVDVEELLIDAITDGDGVANDVGELVDWMLSAYTSNPTKYAGLDEGTIRTVFANRGILNANVSDDWTIPSQLALSLDGESLTFASGKKLIVEGSLEAENTSFSFSGTTGGIEFSSGSTVELKNGTVIQGDGSDGNAQTVAFNDDAVLSGTVTLDHIIATVAFGTTTTISSGATLVMDGNQADPTQLIIEGTLQHNGHIACAGTFSEIINKSNVVGPGTYGMDCVGACLLAFDGTFKIESNVSFSNGAFLAARYGGAFEIDDNTTLIFESDAENFDFDPGSVIEMGDGATIVLENTVDLDGTPGNEIVFKRANPSVAWGHLDVKADGNTFDHVVFDGGEKTVEIRSSNNTFTNVTFKNGWRGISSYSHVGGGRSSFTVDSSTVENATSVGVVAYNTDFTIRNTTIEGSTQAGLWLENATSLAFEDNLVEANGDTSDRSGVEVNASGWFEMDDESNNSVKNNPFHEIEVLSGGQAHLGLYLGPCDMEKSGSFLTPDCGGGGFNNIFDTGTQNTGEYIIHNSSAFGVDAEKNYWGGTPGASDFSGSVDYDFHLSSAVSKGAGGDPVPLQDRIANARARVSQDVNGVLAGDLANLYMLQEIGRIRVPGEKASTMKVISDFRDAAMKLGGNASPTLRAARSRAMLIEMQDALRYEDYDQHGLYVTSFDDWITGPALRLELLYSKISMHEHRKEYRDALSVVQEIRGLQLENEEESVLEVIEGALIDRLEEIHGAEQVQSMAQLALASASKSSPDATEEATSPADLDGDGLMSPYPNPFNPSTRLPFKLSSPGDVEITVYDLLGREVAVLTKGYYNAGRHVVTFSATSPASGTYVVRMSARTDSGQRFFDSEVISLHK